MRLRNGAALVGAAAILATCSAAGGDAALDTDDQKASYAIGLQTGQNLQDAASRLDMDAFIQGVRDAMAEADPALSQEELTAAMQAFGQSIQEEIEKERTAMAESNMAEGEAYLAENGAKDGVVTTESGLQYEVLEAGDGERPSADATVTIHYRGTLIDGTEFDSSYERGQPATFPVGGVIAGFSEALQLMPVGSKYRITIPGELAYGPQGAGRDIGPNATLIFELELLEIAGN
jgi:FKBP-type peptidyl-prolyl cis-trans isomerase